MRKPSAALVVACAALVMSAIGTSLAATRYVITSPGQIKPGSISLSRAQQGRAGVAARAARPQGCARTARPGRRGRCGRCGRWARRGSRPTKLWAQISSAGAVNASSPGVDGPAGHLPRHVRGQLRPGHHALRGDRDAGVDPNFAAPGSSAGGVAGAALVFLYSAGADLAPGFPSATTVLVETTDTAAGGTAAPSTFSIAVFC